MALREGYERTELGILPTDWEVKVLKTISPQQSVGLVINPSTYFDRAGTVPMLVGSNIGENCIDWASAKKITAASNLKLPASRLSAGDLVMVRVGEPGVTAVIPEEFDGCNCASMMIVRRHRSYCSIWLCYVMNSFHGRLQVKGVQYGTAQKQFNISDAVDFKYPVPQLQEQRVIATALSDMDALLEELDRLINKKRDLKQATMQQLLTGKTRLPGFEGEWKLKQLGMLGATFGGLTGKTKADFGGGTAQFITFMNVMSNVIIDSTEFERVHIKKGEQQNYVKSGDLLFNGSSETPEEVALCSLLTEDFESLYLNSFCFGFRLREGVQVDGLFLAYYIRSHEGREIMKLLAQGSTRYNISKRALLKAAIRIPEFPEQAAIANTLSDMDAEIEALQQRRTKTRDLKQAMMQELLTGRTRLLEYGAQASG